MKIKLPFARVLLTTIVFLGVCSFSSASSVIPLSPADHVTASAAVFRGIVVGADCYRDATDGLIYTRTSLRVVEPLKGKFPTIVAIVNPGGSVGDVAQYNGWSPFFKRSEEYLVYAVRRPNGKLTCTQGSSSAVRLQRAAGQLIPAQQSLLDELRNLTSNGQIPGNDVTDQTGFMIYDLTTGLTDRGGGIAARFIQADRGEPIPYLIDADNLPIGITLTQATNAVAQALSAWTAVTSLKFRFEGLQSFGQGADTINASDEKLRIQLHDNYGSINSANTLGIGGQYTSAVLLSGAGWGAGGNVAGNEFFKSSCGFVLLEHGAATMQNLTSFTEVLCHEIGHAISMAHSSEDPSEPNNTLKQSIMYYQAHADGRGATLAPYDPPVIQQAYPTNNTPPYSYSRVLDVTTDSPQPNIPGINEIQLRGYDLQTTNLTLAITNTTTSFGIFALSGTLLKYTPTVFSSGSRADPAGNSFYDYAYARASDGTNASAYVWLRVISLNTDTFPNPTGDGIPDNWMLTYFGNANPTTGLNHGANQDADGDGIKNIDEYRSGMNPTNAASAQKITLITKTNLQFQAKAYELYELHGSTNLVNWFRAANPIIPTTATGTFTDFTNTAPYMFFRVQKVP